MTKSSSSTQTDGAVRDDETLFKWPIVTRDDEMAVLQVLRDCSMSGNDITKVFEREYAAWQGSEYALAYCNGTAALLGAFWACGIGAGDEIICPSMTYWASATGALQLGAAVNFADVEPDSLCIDPDDIEHRIGPNTRAIVVVHYAGHPCDMDRIMPIARKHGIKVIEDNSHGVGSVYKGRKCGTLGDIAAMSMMTGKGFAIGEAGMLTTDDRELFERAMAFGFYERTGGASNYAAASEDVTDPELLRFSGVPIGSFKHRLNQMASAVGRVQLKDYDARTAELRRANDRFWSSLEDIPGLRRHRAAWMDDDSHLGSCYFARGLYEPDAMGGASVSAFCEAVRQNGIEKCKAGSNFPLHLHNVFHHADIFHQGQPTAVAFGQRDVRQRQGDLPVSERVSDVTFYVPWFKHDWPESIERYALAYRRAAEQVASGEHVAG